MDSFVRTIAASSLALAALFTATQALAGGDPVSGKAAFARCAVCHKVTKNSGNGLGPNLFGIGGRKAASATGFTYSSAMKNSGITWSDDQLKAYIADPKGKVPGNRMAFAGISNADQVENVVAYLLTLK